jgi:hypothetical protein
MMEAGNQMREQFEAKTTLAGNMSENGITTLYRPVGQKELDLIAQDDFRSFPPRLEWQPIFYPVLNEEYATFIAREWNTKDAASGFVGYVLRFSVRSEFLDQFEVQKVGSVSALELWIPAEQLSEFNRNIVGKIEIISTYRSEP